MSTKPDSPDVEVLIQLMRTCSLNQVRAELEFLEKKFPELFLSVKCFYQRAAKRKAK